MRRIAGRKPMSSMRSTSSSTSISTRVDVDRAAPQEVLEPAGGRDDQTRSAAKLIELRVLREAAAHQHSIVLRVRHQLHVGLEHLHRQLARRQQNQCADRPALALDRRASDCGPYARSSGSGSSASCRCRSKRSRGCLRLRALAESPSPGPASASEIQPRSGGS